MSHKNFGHKAFWFSGGFALGLTLISVVHANTPNSSVVTEMKAPKVTAPDLEQDYSKLTELEKRYAESWDQQQRIRAATQGVVMRESQPARPIATQKKSINPQKAKRVRQ